MGSLSAAETPLQHAGEKTQYMRVQLSAIACRIPLKKCLCGSESLVYGGTVIIYEPCA